VGFG
jgi:hypothetical protein